MAEKIVYEQVYRYFTVNRLFHFGMHGYRQHRSKCTALLSMYDQCVRAAADGKISGLVLLDLSAEEEGGCLEISRTFKRILMCLRFVCLFVC